MKELEWDDEKPFYAEAFAGDVRHWYRSSTEAGAVLGVLNRCAAKGHPIIGQAQEALRKAGTRFIQSRIPA